MECGESCDFSDVQAASQRGTYIHNLFFPPFSFSVTRDIILSFPLSISTVYIGTPGFFYISHFCYSPIHFFLPFLPPFSPSSKEETTQLVRPPHTIPYHTMQYNTIIQPSIMASFICFPPTKQLHSSSLHSTTLYFTLPKTRHLS